MFKTVSRVSLAALMSSVALSAVQAGQIDYSSFEALFGEPVTVGATGTPQRASDVPVNMTILTAEDIARTPAKTIPDVLRYVPGVNVRQNSAGDYSVAIRGYNTPQSERVLVLLDGRQVYQDYYGSISWDAIPVGLNEIKQIEVIKGPNTALYGFNATSGVVNIVTYNPKFDDYSNLTVSGGSNHYFEGNGTATFQFDRGGVRVAAGGKRQDSFDSSQAFVSPIFSTPPDTDLDNEAHFLKLNGIYEVFEGIDVGVELTKSEAAYNEAILSNQFVQSDYDTWSAKATVSAESDYGLWDFMYYHNSSEPAQALGAFGTAQFDNSTDLAQLSNTFKIGTDHTFRVQGEYRHVTGNAVFSPLEMSYDVASAGAVWNWAITDKLSLSNALRFDALWLEREDNNPAFDRDFTALSVNSGLVYQVTPQDTVRLTYARGVDLPSFVEFGGDPDSDISIVNNVGLDYTHTFVEPDITASASIFYQEIEDQQVLAQLPTDDPNPIDSEAIGGELSLDGRFGDGWSWGLGYAHVSTNDSPDGTVSPFFGISYEDSQSEHIVTTRLGYAQDQWSVDLFTNYMSGFELYNTGGQEIDDVYLAGLNVNYQPLDFVTLSLTAQATLTDEERQGPGQEVEDFVFGSISVTF